MQMTFDCLDANEASCRAVVSYAHDGASYHWHAALWDGGRLCGGLDGGSVALERIAQDVAEHIHKLRLARHYGPD